MLSKFKIAINLTAALVLTGCSLSDFTNWANRVAYGTLDQTTNTVMGEASPFDVEYKPLTPDEQGFIQLQKRKIKIYGSKTEELSLDDVLFIAFKNSREYQNRKEALFSAALNLANERQSWNIPELQGFIAGEANWQKPNGVSPDAGGLGEVSANPSLLQRFVNGGILTFGAAVDLATDFLGSDSLSIGSTIDANFTQPLLRGAWNGFAYEDQYRLERNFEFAVFRYYRYRQTFAANIVTRYYRVLQLRDRLENEKQNIDRLTSTFKLTQRNVEIGNSTRVQLDQAEQNLFSARVRLTSERENYQNAVDQLKILIGLPTLSQVEPDYPEALIQLSKFKPSAKDIPFTVDQAINVALEVRPDVLSQRAAVRDAKRDVDINANNFLPRLDLDVGYSASNPTGSKSPGDINFRNGRRYAKLRFNYPLNQTDNRDAYRNAVIAFSRASRDYDLFLDRVRDDVRTTYRSLAQSRESYEIQIKNVELAKRRRKLAAERQKNGDASTRDVLEAEEALRTAQNGLTSSLINYTTTRLEFLASLGMVRVNQAGVVSEKSKPANFERLNKRYPYTTGDFSKGVNIHEKTNP